MAVFTFYNHGTGGTSLKPASKLEIVNLFGNEHAALDPTGKHARWMITEGVGSDGDPSRYHLQYDPATNSLTETRMSPSKLAIKGLRQIFESATGAGVQANVSNAIAVMKHLRAKNQTPDAINMIGWSRGAVTCIRIAYELYHTEGLSTIPVNIFAVDPVAGGAADKEVQGSFLLPNVRNFIGVLAAGERRSAFAPKTATKLGVSDPSVTNVAFVQFPGIHSDVAKWNSEPGFVVFDMCARFLRAMGTPVPNHARFLMTPSRLIQCYFNMALGEKRTGLKISKMTSKGVKFSEGKWKDRNTGPGDFVKGAGYAARTLPSDPVSDGEVFVNVHHEGMFRDRFPGLYDICFRSTLPPFEWEQAFGSPRLQAERGMLEILSPGTAELLGRANRSLQRADESAWEGVLRACQVFP